jgi:hypothetical protein
MAQTPPQPPKTAPDRRTLGPPLAWSEADLDTLSQVGPADAKAAAALWKRDSPSWSRDLIDAQPEAPS